MEYRPDAVDYPSEDLFDELAEYSSLEVGSQTIEDLADEHNSRSAFIYDVLDDLVLDKEFDVEQESAKNCAANPDWDSKGKYVLENFDTTAAEYAKEKFDYSKS